MAGLISTIFTVCWFGTAGSLLGLSLGGWAGAVLGAAAGGVLGAVFGRAYGSAESYEPTLPGRLLFVVDHTWSLVNTVAGALFLAGNLVAGNRVDGARSRHSGAVQLARGVFPGYLTTIGTVIAGVHEPVHAHEHGHVLQARLFGPLYFPLVIVNYVLATIAPYWLLYHDRTRYPIDGVRAYFEHGVYPHTWHEAWCYKAYGPAR